MPRSSGSSSSYNYHVAPHSAHGQHDPIVKIHVRPWGVPPLAVSVPPLHMSGGLNFKNAPISSTILSLQNCFTPPLWGRRRPTTDPKIPDFINFSQSFA